MIAQATHLGHVGCALPAQWFQRVWVDAAWAAMIFGEYMRWLGIGCKSYAQFVQWPQKLTSSSTSARVQLLDLWHD